MIKKIMVDVQLALDEISSVKLPGNKLIQQWATAAIDGAIENKNQKKNSEMQMTVRVVEETEISFLNKKFRHKSGATNILSFPFVPPQGIPMDEILYSLGDLVVCATVVDKEAKEQHKKNIAHWAHIIIHGTLHLMGFDHQNEKEARDMESLETKIMFELGFPDPYAEI